MWTTQYFEDIVSTLSTKAIVLTYSIATPIRLGMSENGLNIQEYKYDQKRRATIGSNFEIDDKSYSLKVIDMKKKKINNPQAKSLQDTL